MPFVDAQIHLWGSGTPRPAHRKVAAFTAEDALREMDEAGVDSAVVHPPSWEPGVERALNATQTYPDRFAAFRLMSLSSPLPREDIEQWRNEPGRLGLRCGFEGDGLRERLDDGSLDWIWETAQDAGVPFTALATDWLADIGRIAERFPGLRFTIDHLGGRGKTTTLADPTAMAHMPVLLALAKFPNVAVKATGAPRYSLEDYPFSDMHTYLKQVYDAFGPHRMFWGTDISKMPCSWRECLTMFTEELPWLNDEDKRLIMGDAICAWWGWDRPMSP